MPLGAKNGTCRIPSISFEPNAPNDIYVYGIAAVNDDSFEPNAPNDIYVYGIAVVYDEPCIDGDTFAAGAFDDAIFLSKSHIFPIFDNHNRARQVGVVTELECKDGQLRALCRIFASQRDSVEIKKMVTGLSVGYISIEESKRDGKRLISRAILYEISVCKYPKQPLARVAGIYYPQADRE